MSFSIFWLNYPNKKGKTYAKKCWDKLEKEKKLPDIKFVVDAIKNQVKEKAYLKKLNRFCPEWKNPSTWLNQGCWEDHCELPQKENYRRFTNGAVATQQKLTGAFNALVSGGKPEAVQARFKLSDYDMECVMMSFNGGAKRANHLAGRMLK